MVIITKENVMTARAARTEKLDLRLTPDAKRVLRAAADVRQKSVTEFVLDSALTAAEDVLTEQRSIRLNAAQWTAFMEALDAPPRRHPRLEQLLTEPSVFD
jgi:uncharacterized protein (DUF1778 family)